MTDVLIPTQRGDMPGYLAVPPGSGPWPGVVVVFDIGGMSQDLRNQTDWLASEGYVALLPDLYWGRSWVRCIRSIMRDAIARKGPTFDDLDASREYLERVDGCSGKTGVIGFCMGGGFALLLAPGHGFSASSVNYGGVPKDAERVLAAACPVVASYGARDRSQRNAAARLDRALTAIDVAHDVKEYPLAGHGFLNDHYGAGDKVPVLFKVMGTYAANGYHEQSARDARQRILAFFDEHLR